MTKTSLGMGNFQYTLTPGRCTNLPNFNTGNVVVLEQASTNGAGGVFYIDGGGLHSTARPFRWAAAQAASCSTTGLPAPAMPTRSRSPATRTAPSTSPGSPPAPTPASRWQDRTSKVELLIEGGGNFSIQGTLYAAGDRLNVNGNGKSSSGDITGYFVDDAGTQVDGSSRIGSQFIVNNLSLGGNGNIRLDYVPQKLARTRVITLVE